jgi:SAM-dependent methyltransferase
MSTYYSGRGARSYNTRWRAFSQGTHAAVLSNIDFDILNTLAHQRGTPLRICDIACGTGLLLEQLIARLPNSEVYGLDASAAMLGQAKQLLDTYAHAHLIQRTIGVHFEQVFPADFCDFDLITCSNALHDLRNPVGFLQALGTRLAPGGLLVVEDYARRQPLFPWMVVEWLGKIIERGHVRAYTLGEADALAHLAGLTVHSEQTFVVDWLWHGWLLRLGVEH